MSTPAWAALIGITNQGRVLAGQGTLDGPGQTLPQIYALPGGDLHDILTGNNGNPAGPGYDLVTGRGSPDARRVVADLSGNQPPQQIFSDNFNRANSSNLGINWVQATGSIGVQNNLAVATASVSNIALYAGAAQADVDVNATITDPSVAGSAANLVARYSGPGDNNMYMGAIYTTNGSTFNAQIYKIVAGASTLLASAAVGSGTGTLDFQVLGDFLKLSFNGVGVAAFDTQITAPGLAGIKGTLNSTWDNFTLSTLTPALPFSDNFNRANSSNLGANWVQGMAGSFGVQNNQALASASAINLAVYTYDAQPDVNVSADIALTSGSGQIAELVGRYSGSGDANMYTGGVTANSNGTFTAAIYKNIGGTRTLLGSQTVTTGTGTLTFQIVGSDLRLLFTDSNGNVLGLVSVFDTSITTSGAVGIRGSNGVTFDNFFILN